MIYEYWVGLVMGLLIGASAGVLLVMLVKGGTAGHYPRNPNMRTRETDLHDAGGHVDVAGRIDPFTYDNTPDR